MPSYAIVNIAGKGGRENQHLAIRLVTRPSILNYKYEKQWIQNHELQQLTVLFLQTYK